MPQVPITMPQLGESIAEATVIRFLHAEGATVRADQDLMEVETNKATMNIAAPCPGRIAQLTAREGESYPVGATLGYLEATQADMDRHGLSPAPAAAPVTTLAPANGSDTPAPTPAPRTVEPTIRGLPVPANAAGAGYLSPRLKARMADLGMHAADLAGVAGSGAAGRVTVQDFEAFVASIEQHRLTPASTMRVAVADAMRRSWTRPLATVGLIVRLDILLAHRRTAEPKPGPALYALRALALALAENSAPAGRLVGNKIVHPKSIDVGFAVEADDGVLVPVIRGADRTALGELTARYNDLVDLARRRRLPADAVGGSVATVTNFGTFGLIWATPIPLPEQSLVLGLGAGRKSPAWDEAAQKFVPVIEANLTLSFDHRVIDGGAAGRLLVRIAELMQQPQRL